VWNAVFAIEPELVITAEKRLRDQKPMRISVRGLKAPDKDREDLESQIREMVTAELKQLVPTKRTRNDITVSLKDLPFPDEDIRRVESRVQEMVRKTIPKPPGQASQKHDIVICGCGPCCDPPGTNVDMSAIDPSPSPLPLLIGICLKNDVLEMR